MMDVPPVSPAPRAATAVAPGAVTTPLSARLGGAVLAVAIAHLGSSCVGETPAREVPAPDVNRLTVFFPLDEGLVNGRGSPGPKPAEYQYVFIRPHPSRNIFTAVRLQEDGSFTFSIAATGNDIIELAYAETDKADAKRGAPAFVQVPPRTAAPQSFFCCRGASAPRGRCAETTTANMCTPMIAFPECETDADCSFLSGDNIPIRPTDCVVSQPNASGNITVTCDNPAYALHLLRFENRGQRAVGGTDPRVRSYTIADEQGRATATFIARGDDEIVVRVFALDGYSKSREHAMYVPDADLAGIDVVGMFPFEGLKDRARGKVGIRLAPYGADARGICAPSSEPGPSLCFSGGHEAPSTGQNLNFNGGLDYRQIDVTLRLDDIEARIEPPSAEAQAAANTKFTDGNVLAPPQAVIVIVDHSSGAADRDGQAARFRAAENFIRSARTRDQVAVFVTGSHPGDNVFEQEPGTGFTVMRRLARRDQPDDRLNPLRGLFEAEAQMPAGDNGMYAAVTRAAAMLFADAKNLEGRILIISSTNPSEATLDEMDEALQAVSGDERTRARYPVYTVTLPVCEQAGGICTPLPTQRNDFESLSGFSAGRFAEVASADDFLNSVATVNGGIFGAFVLTYEIDVPALTNRKTAGVALQVTVRLPDPLDPTNESKFQERSTTYNGIIELRDNLGN